MDEGLVGRTQRVRAMRAGRQRGLDDVVGIGCQCAAGARSAATGLPGALGQVRLLALRGRDARIVRGPGWRVEPGLKVGDPRGQPLNLYAQSLDLRLLRQDQADQVVLGKGEEGFRGSRLP